MPGDSVEPGVGDEHLVLIVHPNRVRRRELEIPVDVQRAVWVEHDDPPFAGQDVPEAASGRDVAHADVCPAPRIAGDRCGHAFDLLLWPAFDDLELEPIYAEPSRHASSHDSPARPDAPPVAAPADRWQSARAWSEPSGCIASVYRPGSSMRMAGRSSLVISVVHAQVVLTIAAGAAWLGRRASADGVPQPAAHTNAKVATTMLRFALRRATAKRCTNGIPLQPPLSRYAPIE